MSNELSGDWDEKAYEQLVKQTGGRPRNGPPVPDVPEQALKLPARVTCGRCGRAVDGWLGFDLTLRVVDSGGFVLFNAGPTCDPCLGDYRE